MSDKPISDLRRRMLEDMAVRKFGDKTKHDYIRHIESFAKFLGRSPDTATAEDVRRFQVHLTENGVQPPTLNSSASALRFITPLASALPLARDGQIKLLAVTTPERAAAAPDLMTASEGGHPELTVEAPLGFFGLKTMPIELRERIAADVKALASDPAISQRLSGLGMVARGSTPAEYAAILAEQRNRWAALARTYGIRPRQ